jgi:hypothetical protein
MRVTGATTPFGFVNWTNTASFGGLQFTENGNGTLDNGLVGNFLAIGSTFATVNRRRNLSFQAYNNLEFWTYQNTGSALRVMDITSSGNVGIGTTAPDRKLEINSATGINLRLTYNDSDGSAANYTDFTLGSNGALTMTSTANAFTFGNGVADTDLTFNFTGTTNSGVIKWMEDEDYFQFNDDIFLGTGEAVMFEATTTKLQYGNTGDLDVYTPANKTLELQTVVYNDIYIDISPRTTGAGKPTLATFSGNIQKYTFAVNDITELGTNELLHDWKEGTAIELHVHWASNGTNVDDRAVKWEIDYTWANTVSAGGTTAFAAATTASAETTIPTATNVDKTHYYTSVVTFTPTGGKIGAALLMSLKRIASAGTAPTNNPWCLMVGVHYQIDTLGSRQQSTK